jgi:hypothetical protein
VRAPGDASTRIGQPLRHPAECASVPPDPNILERSDHRDLSRRVPAVAEPKRWMGLLMNFDMSRFQALTENLAVEGEVCDLAQAKLSTETETDTEIAPLIEKVGATSMAEIDRLMAELQAQKNFSAIRGRANSARDGSL